MEIPKFYKVDPEPQGQYRLGGNCDMEKGKHVLTDWCCATSFVPNKLSSSSDHENSDKSHGANFHAVGSKLRIDANKSVIIGHISWHFQQQLGDRSKLVCTPKRAVSPTLLIPQIRRQTGITYSSKSHGQVLNQVPNHQVIPGCKRKRTAVLRNSYNNQNLSEVSARHTALIGESGKVTRPKFIKAYKLETGQMCKSDLSHSETKQKSNVALGTISLVESKGMERPQVGTLNNGAKFAKNSTEENQFVKQNEDVNGSFIPEPIPAKNSMVCSKKKSNYRDLDVTTVTLRVREKAKAHLLQELTVPEMRCFLKAVQQTTGGKKSDLQLRIMKYLDLEQEPGRA